MTIKDAVVRICEIADTRVATEEYLQLVSFLNRQESLSRDKFPYIAWWSAMETRGVEEKEDGRLRILQRDDILPNSDTAVCEVSPSGDFLIYDDVLQKGNNVCGSLFFRTDDPTVFIEVLFGYLGDDEVEFWEDLFADDGVNGPNFCFSLFLLYETQSGGNAKKEVEGIDA